MNYYYQPNIAALVVDWVNCILPGQRRGRRCCRRVILDRGLCLVGDPKGGGQPLTSHQKSTLDKAHVFKSLSASEETQFNTLFADLTGTA